MEILLLIGRVLFGGYFMMHGYNHIKYKKNMIDYAKSKNALRPEFTVPFTGIILILSGLSILVGAFIELAYFALIIFLLSTSFVMHKFWNIKDQNQRQIEQINFMKNIALVGALFILLYFGGPWPLSL